MPPSFASNKSALAKASLSKRLLFPTWPSNDLPPLFAAPATPPELTAEVYDFVALALRAFVNPWWTKITRYDKDFLPDITRILTHVVRAIEARVQDADLAPLVFRDVPAILTQHYRDYRNAASKLSTSYASGAALPLPVLFHGLQPHMAVAPDGSIEPEYVRQIVDHILKACLPEEDYAPEPQRFIIREIVLKILLKDVFPKITQPWFIQKTILDLLGQEDDVLTKTRPSSPPASAFSFHTLIVVALSAIQALSGACLAMIHAYKQAVGTIKRVNQTPPRPQPTRRVPSPFPRPRSPTSIPIPASPMSPSISASSSVSSWAATPPDTSLPHQIPSPDTPSSDYALPSLTLVSEIFTTPARMASASIMHTISLLLVLFAPFLDRLLPYLLAQTLSPKLVLTIARNAKRTLFPNGYPAPPPVDPTPEEQAQMRARLLAYRGKSPWVETHVLPLVLGSDPTDTLAAALDPLMSRECNVHLVILLLDAIIGTLFPELLGE
ncbi:PXA domain-containing protein [Mycena albidolilacea]|uniref:PXA domain-containing protein n=1 Tax=Mycena albidolilacea TaxID=1033008 RepID=A0AAD7AGP1_9AGAR|nr:PXA domain-containing protein [Mycena albidolilacea]